MRSLVGGLVGLAVSALGAPPALAQSTGLDDLVGARTGQAEGEVQRRGYRNTGGSKGDDRAYANWWNAARRQCVVIATMDGRYASITPTLPPDCNQAASRDDNQRDRSRPDIGYGRPDARTGAPSYAQDEQGGGVDSVELGLVCFGDGQRPAVASSSGWTWNSRSDRYDYGTRTELTQEHFDASLMLQLGGGGGRIRLPKKLIPPIHSRGQDDWWALDNVSMDPDTIRATYRLNGLNKPRLTVDRRSGRITIVGMGDYAFRGSCDVAGGPRRF